MTIAAIIAILVPLVVYVVVGLQARSRAESVDEYFIYGQSIDINDYANTSVGYALQMAALFLFAAWAILYGFGALWTVVFWGIGYLVLYALLRFFIPYRASGAARTMHGYVADRLNAGASYRRLAAGATILGLWGTMMAELEYSVQVLAPVATSNISRFIIGGALLSFGVSYIIVNGFRAEVRTERFQVPIAYGGLLVVLLLLLPAVWAAGRPETYRTIWLLFGLVLILMLVAKWPQRFEFEGASVRRIDPQILLPVIGLLGLFVVELYIRSGSIAQIASRPVAAGAGLGQGISTQLKAQGMLGVLSLLVANALWMPADLSTWQRIAAVRGVDSSALPLLRRGTLRVALESPISWCLGILLGLMLWASGIFHAGQDPFSAVSSLSDELAAGAVMGYLGGARPLVFGVFVAATMAVMLSTIDSIISAISFTAFADLGKHGAAPSLRRARFTTVVIAATGLAIYPILRVTLGASLPTLLYGAYAAQLAFFPSVLAGLTGRYRSALGGRVSIICGFVATGGAVAWAAASGSEIGPVIPPLAAVFCATVGYGVGAALDRPHTEASL